MEPRNGSAWLRVLWAGVAIPLVGLFALSIPAVYARKSEPLATVRVGLDQLGVPVTWYAGWWTLVLSVFGVVCIGAGTAIVWRRPRERVAWFVALFLVSLGSVNAPNVEALVWQRPALEAVATIAFQFFLACLVLFLFTFPDGRAHPRWSWAIVAVAVAGHVFVRGTVAEPVTTAFFGAILVGLVGGVVSQVHRYRRKSGPEERQQTRWVLFAAVAAVTVQLAFPLMEGLPAVARPGVAAAVHDVASVAGVSLGFGLVPVALWVALLRHRLWDLDLFVSRALVFGGLTVGLLAVYAAVVTGIGQILRTPGNAGGFLLGAAALALAFAPLRDRLQCGVNRLVFGQRHEPYQALTALGERLEQTTASTAVLPTIVDTVAAALRSPYVAICIDRAGVSEVVAATGTPTVDPVRLPLVHRHEVVGELLAAPRSPNVPFNPADLELLTALARQASAAVQAFRLTGELRRSRQLLVVAREEERRRLRRDLHDGLGPALASMTLQAEAAHDLVDERPDLAGEILVDLTGQLQASTADIRRLVYDLRPAALDDLGLIGALRTFAERSRSDRLQIRLDVPATLPALSAAGEVAAYRIVQEAVANVLRHAAASTCIVTLRVDAGALVIEVCDDGRGLEPDRVEGVGLRSMRERAGELAGTCVVTARPGGGTRVLATLPPSSTAAPA